MLLAGTAAGQIMECIDAKGRKEFATVCPPGTVKENKLMKSGAGASSAPLASCGPSLTEREMDFRKRAAQQKDNEAKADKARVEAAENERNRIDARSQLKTLQDGGRIGRTDPVTGERSFLEDKDRPAEIARAQKAVEAWCKK
jgi:hypothetical protein